MANILASVDDYQFWRDEKLASAATNLGDCLVEVNNPAQLSTAEKQKISQLCQRNNFALFNLPPSENVEADIIRFNQQFGLDAFDAHLYAQHQGLARITQAQKAHQRAFIPYTNKNLGWHTDGYYNAIDKRIRAFSLFCVRGAKSGGENQWIDQQLIYLLLREQNPDVAKALTHPEAMSIPEHKIDGKIRRQTSIGPIFFVDEKTKKLSMRYTQRKKNIEFHPSSEIKQAVDILDALLNAPTPYHFAHTMRANQGLLCNNILHKRTAFTDNPDAPRLLLRGRYFNHVA